MLKTGWPACLLGVYKEFVSMVFQFFIWKQNRRYRKPRKPWKESRNSGFNSNKIWWPRHNAERLMTCQRSHPTSWEALGTPHFPPRFHLAQGIHHALPSSYRIQEGSAAKQHASREGRARAWRTFTASISTPPRPACFLQRSLILQTQKGTAKSWNACRKLHDSSCVQEIRQCPGKLKKQAV